MLADQAQAYQQQIRWREDEDQPVQAIVVGRQVATSAPISQKAGEFQCGP